MWVASLEHLEPLAAAVLALAFLKMSIGTSVAKIKTAQSAMNTSP
jgi:hypothetical protein